MKSQYGDRDTVGTTYNKIQGNVDKTLVTGDVSREMLPGLVDDINEALQSNPFEGRPFYVNVAEKRDAQMPNAFRRKIIKSPYRPFPEYSTTVFHMAPKTQTVRYCWDLPHHTEMYNILDNRFQYPLDYIQSILQWQRNQLDDFGFLKVRRSDRMVEGYERKTINSYKKHYKYFCKYIGMCDEDIEIEKKLGFFWIPNKYFKDTILNARAPQVSIYSAASAA